jgi:hypothetical protein
MSSNKKRKTRKQKERAARRRDEQTPAGTHRGSPASPGLPADGRAALAAENSRETETRAAMAEQDTAAGARARHTERIRLMKISILVFAVLAGLQLILWGLDYSGVLSLSAM